MGGYGSLRRHLHQVVPPFSAIEMLSPWIHVEQAGWIYACDMGLGAGPFPVPGIFNHLRADGIEFDIA
jgi:hypothetical protein